MSSMPTMQRNEQSARLSYLTWEEGPDLRFDHDHGECAPHLVEAAYVPGDGFLDLFHGVGFDPGHYVIDTVDDVDFLDIGDLPELLQEVLFSAKVSVN